MSAQGIRLLTTCSDIRAATLVGVVAALCVELNGVDSGRDDTFASRAAGDTAPPRQGEVAEPAMLTA
jgi:hypothetical protein